MGMTDFGSDIMLNSLLGVVAIPATLYLALVRDEPEVSDDGDDLDEPTDAAYARVAVSTGSAAWSASSSGSSVYLNNIIYAAASEEWGAIYYWVLCTAAASGDVLLWGDFDEGFEVIDTQVITIPAQALVLSISDEEENVIM